jgi:hypothetical protein
MILSLICPSAYAASTNQKLFSSPGDAVQAMVNAVKDKDEKTLTAILGPGSRELIFSGDEVDDNVRRDLFLKLYGEKAMIQKVGDRKALLFVGKDDWPIPIPLNRKGKSWFFNSKAGREEILNRRIGANELNVIQVCLAYADAQREYALMDVDGNGLFEYAQKFASDKGKKDGLYWETKEGEAPSPLGPFFVTAKEEGYTNLVSGERVGPYHGYYYRILFAQGKNAQDGAYNYVIDGKMIGGFALVAYPARYGNSGIMTFMVNQNGTVYEKNLGKRTEKIGRTMKTFDPDKTWRKVE